MVTNRPPAGEPIPQLGGTAAGRPRPAGSASTRTRCLAVGLLGLLERGPALVGTQAARRREVIDRNHPTTPVLAVVALGWLEAAEQVLTAGSTAQDLQILASLAGRQG